MEKEIKGILTFVDIAASNTLQFSAFWNGPAAWTTKSTSGV